LLFVQIILNGHACANIQHGGKGHITHLPGAHQPLYRAAQVAHSKKQASHAVKRAFTDLPAAQGAAGKVISSPIHRSNCRAANRGLLLIKQGGRAAYGILSCRSAGRFCSPACAAPHGRTAKGAGTCTSLMQTVYIKHGGFGRETEKFQRKNNNSHLQNTGIMHKFCVGFGELPHGKNLDSCYTVAEVNSEVPYAKNRGALQISLRSTKKYAQWIAEAPGDLFEISKIAPHRLQPTKPSSSAGALRGGMLGKDFIKKHREALCSKKWIVVAVGATLKTRRPSKSSRQKTCLWTCAKPPPSFCCAAAWITKK
jgi:hypothetical protein